MASLFWCLKQSHNSAAAVCTKIRKNEEKAATWNSMGVLLSLGKARLGSGDITPLLDDWLLDLPWVGAGPGADLLGDVNALLGGLKQGHQLGDVPALLLGLQVASLLGHLGDDGLLLGEALLWAGDQLAAGRAAKLLGDLLTLSLRRVLLDILRLLGTDLLGPLGALGLSRVTLGDILALLLVFGGTLNNIILDVVLVVAGGTLGLVDSPTFLWALALADQGSVAELDLLSGGNLPVVDEALLDEVLLALLLLLGLEVSGVGGVALLGVAVLALNDIVVLGLLDHHDLVDTPLAGGGNGSDVQWHVITTSLTGAPGWEGGGRVVGVVMVVVVVVVVSSSTGSSTLVEGEGSPQVLAGPVGAAGGSTTSQEGQHAELVKSVHDFS